LPILFVFADVLDAERVAVVDKQRFAALAEHKLQLPVEPFFARRN
jgi:hypothetical protein